MNADKDKPRIDPPPQSLRGDGLRINANACRAVALAKAEPFSEWVNQGGIAG